MTQFSQSDIAQLWVNNGGNPQYAPMASAVAMAESGGNSQATNVNSNGSTDRGLFQINSSHGSQSTFDVNQNVKAAIQISNNGTNWRPWCTAWSNGNCTGTFLGTGSPYQKYVNNSLTYATQYVPVPGAAATPAGSSGTGSSSGSGSSGGITGAVQSVANALNPSTWITWIETDLFKPALQYAWWIGETMLGVGLVFGGVILLTNAAIRRPGQQPSPAMKAAETAATISTGGEAKVATKVAKPRVYKARVSKPPARPEPSRRKVIDGEVVQRKEIAA